MSPWACLFLIIRYWLVLGDAGYFEQMTTDSAAEEVWASTSSVHPKADTLEIYSTVEGTITIAEARNDTGLY